MPPPLSTSLTCLRCACTVTPQVRGDRLERLGICERGGTGSESLQRVAESICDVHDAGADRTAAYSTHAEVVDAICALYRDVLLSEDDQSLLRTPRYTKLGACLFTKEIKLHKSCTDLMRTAATQISRQRISDGLNGDAMLEVPPPPERMLAHTPLLPESRFF